MKHLSWTCRWAFFFEHRQFSAVRIDLQIIHPAIIDGRRSHVLKWHDRIKGQVPPDFTFFMLFGHTRFGLTVHFLRQLHQSFIGTNQISWIFARSVVRYLHTFHVSRRDCAILGGMLIGLEETLHQ